MPVLNLKDVKFRKEKLVLNFKPPQTNLFNTPNTLNSSNKSEEPNKRTSAEPQSYSTKLSELLKTP
jgi:hypothetical protein